MNETFPFLIERTKSPFYFLYVTVSLPFLRFDEWQSLAFLVVSLFCKRIEIENKLRYKKISVKG